MLLLLPTLHRWQHPSCHFLLFLHSRLCCPIVVNWYSINGLCGCMLVAKPHGHQHLGGALHLSLPLLHTTIIA